MNQSQLQELLADQTEGATSPITELLEPLMPILSLLLVVGVVLTIVIIVFFIVNIVQKQRQHNAIMRIDKNVQRLVDAKLPDQSQINLADTRQTPPDAS